MKIIDTNVQILPLKYLHENTGQIEGVPANPRILRDSKYRALLESLKKDDLTGVLPLKIYEKQVGEYVVLGGNMRLKALRELHDGDWAVSCVKIPDGTPAEVLRKIVVLDNSTYGEWDMDMLANDWDTQELADWGVDVPFEEESETSKLSDVKVNDMYYEPEKKPSLKLSDCIDTTKYDAKMAALREMDLTEKQLQVLEMFARRFIRIDFESVANYYAFNASDSEKDAIERLRLVLVDSDGGG